jgi:hypothetical protein
MLSPVKLGLAAFAAVSCIMLVPGTAEAGRLFKWRFFQPEYYTYYPGQENFYGPDDYNDDYYYVPRKKRQKYYEQYEQQDSYYDPQYDEPVYVKPLKRKSATFAPVTKPAVKKANIASVKKPVATTTAKTAGGMSCDKASSIITGYGFSSVKPTSCKGQTYAFNAVRSGKNYVISLNAASGELTEVKKVR